MRPQLHAGTNLGPPFNRSASSLTPSKTLALWFFSPSCHCSHACSSFSFSSLLFLSLFFLLVYPALFHSHLTTLAPLQSTHPHHSLCCFLSSPPPSHPSLFSSYLCFLHLSLRFLPVYSLLCWCLSFAHFFIFSATRFLSLPLFVGFLSLPAPVTPSPATVSISLFPTASLSSPLIPCLSTQWIQRVFIFFFPPLNGFATLPNPSSPSASLSPSITLSLVLSFPLPLHRPHIHILLFCHPISCAPHHPPISSTILSHFYLLHSLTRNPSSLSPGHSSFSFIPLKPSFFSHFHDRCTRSRHICGRSNLPNTHLYLALYLTSNFSSTISRVDAHLQYWQKTHLRKITRPIIDRADWRLMHHLRVSICLLLIAARHFGPLPLE